MHSDKEYVLQTLKAGAKGYLLKGARLPELELAIHSVARSETYLSPAASQHVIDVALQSTGLDNRTERQIQVLQMIAKCATRKKLRQNFRSVPNRWMSIARN